MIALLLALQAVPAQPPVPVQPPVLGPIGKQTLPAKGCAAFLWSASDRTLVAMAVADPAHLRIMLDGRETDLPLASAERPAGYGFSASSRYGGGDLAATLDLTIAERADLTAGAGIPAATLRIDRTGRDGIVVPLAGLVGCGT